MKKLILPALLLSTIIFLFGLFLLVSGCGEIISGALKTITITPDPGVLVAGYETEFVATGRDGDGNVVSLTGSINVNTITSSSGADAMRIESQWVSDGKRYAKILGLETGTGEVTCTSGSIHSTAYVTVIVGTVETIKVACADSLPITNGNTATFIATGETGDIDIYITPTWEIIGTIGSIESYSGNTATFRASNVGFGTIEAYFAGKKGSKEVLVVGNIYANKSAYIDAAEPAASHYNLGFIKVGYDKGNSVPTREAYIAFNLSNIPSNAIIDSASLILKVSNFAPDPGSTAIKLHNIQTSWNETLTWNSGKPTIDSTILTNYTVTTTGDISMDIKDDLQDWVDGTTTTYGLYIRLLDAAGDQGSITFYDRTVTKSSRPRISVNFHLP